MRTTRRSLLEVHGVSHAALQKHPHPDVDYEIGLPFIKSLDRTQEWRNRESPSKPEIITDIRSPTKNINTNFEALPHDHSFSKRTPSLQTVFSYQTESSCSWSEDSDKESTVRVQKKLQESENVLYNDYLENTDYLETDDDISWKKAFPYLRVVGKKMTPRTDVTVCGSEDVFKIDAQSFLQEEMIEQDGVYEDNNSNSNANSSSDCNFRETDIQQIKEKVLERLTDHLTSKVIEWIAALGETRRKSSISRIHSSVVRLPPVTTGNSPPSRRSPISRPLTGIQHKKQALVQPSKTSEPEMYLQGLLTISSKVLQNRFQDKVTDEWYKEVLPTPDTLKSCTPRKLSASSDNVKPKRKQDNFLPVHIKDDRLQNFEEIESTVTLPNINQKISSSHSQKGAKFGKGTSHRSHSFHGQRLLTASKNLPFLKHGSETVQQSFTSKRTLSALPNKLLTARRQSAAITPSYIADQLKDVSLQVPFSVQHTNMKMAQHIVLSPFTLLPIVKSLTPLNSVTRPKSKLDRRKLSTQIQD